MSEPKLIQKLNNEITELKREIKLRDSKLFNRGIMINNLNFQIDYLNQQIKALQTELLERDDRNDGM